MPGIARQIAAEYGVGPSTVMVSGARTAPDLAAFANSAMVRSFDINDAYGSGGGVGHPSDYIPAVLAAAEASNADGRTVIAAIAAVYEIFGRLTDALGLGVEGWDHVTAGAVASAAGAGLVWGLDAGQIANAMSLALVPNFALQATRLGDLSAWKGCAAPNACRNGVFAARLAARGLTGPLEPFEGRGGSAAAVGKPIDHVPLRDDRPAVVATGAHMKKYPLGFFGQGAVDAALALRPRVGTAERIRRIEVGTFEFGSRVMAGDRSKWRPQTRESADHSIPYAVATALVRGRLGIDDYTDEALRDPAVLSLLDRLEVHVDAECQAAWPRAIMTKLTVTRDDGSAESVTVLAHRGHALDPMSDAEVVDKFHSLAARTLDSSRRQALVSAVWDLARVPVPDLLALTVVAK